MEIVRSGDPSLEAGKRLTKILEDNSNHPVLFMLSGGSAFDILPTVATQVLGPNITICVLDERYSNDETINNFSQLKKTDFFNKAIERGSHYISTQVKEGLTIDLLRDNWNYELLAWRKNNPTGIIVATLGIGLDGHTAGILPNIPEIEYQTEEWVISFTTTRLVNQYPDRVSVSLNFIQNEIDEIVVYAAGENKREIVYRLIEREESLEKIPAGIIKYAKKATLYTEG